MSEMKYIQTELDKHNYSDLKKTAEKHDDIYFCEIRG